MLGRDRSFPELCADLSDATLRLDERAGKRAFKGVARGLDRATPDELTAGLRALRTGLAEVPLGNGPMLARVAAGLVEAGGDPVVALDVLAGRIADGLERAARYPALRDALGEVVVPRNRRELDELKRRVSVAAPTLGLTDDEAMTLVQARLAVNDWIPGLLLPLQQRAARRALPQRDRLTAATAAVAEYLEDAPWLLGLLLVLDDEPFLVLHRGSGRAYALTVSGVGDNFQLHTLLAATLIGDPAGGLLPGEPPTAAEVAAATDGDDVYVEGGVRGAFNLADAHGAWIWNEGRPADIPVLDGHRVVVLDPPPYERRWNAARAYPLMPPSVRLDRVLPEDEAAAWAANVAPGVSCGRAL